MLSLWKEEVENWVCNLACIECSKGGCARAFPPRKKKKWKKNAFFLLCTFRKVIHEFCDMVFLWEKHKLPFYDVVVCTMRLISIRKIHYLYLLAIAYYVHMYVHNFSDVRQ